MCLLHHCLLEFFMGEIYHKIYFLWISVARNSNYFGKKSVIGRKEELYTQQISIMPLQPYSLNL